MSLTTQDKKYIDETITLATLSKFDRLEVLLEDQRDDITIVLELLTDQHKMINTLQDHGERLNKVENVQDVVVSTLGIHSMEIKKLGGGTV